MRKFKIGDRISFDGADGCTSIDYVFDIWDIKGEKWVELEQNDIVLSPEKQKELNLKIYKK